MELIIVLDLVATFLTTVFIGFAISTSKKLWLNMAAVGEILMAVFTVAFIVSLIMKIGG